MAQESFLALEAAEAAAQQAEVRFAVIGCGPDKPDEERQLSRAVRSDPGVKGSAFLVHLGSAMTHGDFVNDDPYARLSELLRLNERPTLLLPGRTEWAEAHGDRQRWRRHFLHFEAVSGGDGDGSLREALPVQRQNDHPENFAFVRNGVLFIGIDLPGGDDVSEILDFDEQLGHASRWVDRCMGECAGSVRAAVLFAHAFPGARHETFSDALRRRIARFGHPLLYLHADSYYLPEDRPHEAGPPHTRPRGDRSNWRKDRPWRDVDLLRVQTDRFGVAPPLRVAVHAAGDTADELFDLDRQYFRGPYLNAGTAHSMTIVWRTGRPIRPEVRIGRTPGVWEQHYGPRDIRSHAADHDDPAHRLHSAPEDALQYDVTVTGLEPGTKYHYGIYDGDELLVGADERHHFQTAPAPGAPAPLRFMIFGDSGRGNQPQADVHRAVRRFTAAERRPIDLFLHCGDMAYTSGTDAQFQANFFRPYQSTLRHATLWPTMSNHEGQTSDGNTDTGPYYDAFTLPTQGEAGGVPSGTSSYFGFDYGNVHFICLCSFGINLGPDSEQVKWLRANLKHVREQGQAKWLIAYFHHPPYSKGSHDSDTEKGLIEVREHIMPVLEEGGVDLVFCGHSHTYERSMLIDGAYETPTVAEGYVLDDGDGDPEGDGAYRKSATIEPHEGTVAVVCGCGGTSMGRRGTSPVMKRVLVEHGAVIVDVEGDVLRANMLGTDGRILDRFAIERKGRVKPQRLLRPKQLPEYISYSRTRARLLLDELPEKTGATTITLEIPPVPRDVEATLTWHAEGTNWCFEPTSQRFRIDSERGAMRTIDVRCAGDLFPLPEPWITYHGDAGDEPKKHLLEVPPWRKLTLHPLAQAPEIDGRITPEEIAGLARQGDFIDFRGTGYEHVPTGFYAGLHGNALYVAIECDEPEMDRLYISRPQAEEAHFSDDCVELFLQREGEEDFYHLVVNAIGQRIDAKNGWQPHHRNWSGKWQSAVHREADRWSVEMLVNLEMLGEPVGPGDVLRLNVGRNHAIHRQYTQWSYTNHNPHAAHYYGKVVVAKRR